jgi:hypothetical protein
MLFLRRFSEGQHLVHANRYCIRSLATVEPSQIRHKVLWLERLLNSRERFVSSGGLHPGFVRSCAMRY